MYFTVSEDIRALFWGRANWDQRSNFSIYVAMATKNFLTNANGPKLITIPNLQSSFNHLSQPSSHSSSRQSQVRLLLRSKSEKYLHYP